jgi:hypothetical protein
MATNKRKDAAALFELIDKSTLKVPKSGGSLKIPNWWSNKTEPPPKEGGTARAGAAAQGRSDVAVAEPPEAPAPRAVTEPTPAQPRLFEPPPANVTPTSTPSIRPPLVSVAAVLADPVGVSAASPPSPSSMPASPSTAATLRPSASPAGAPSVSAAAGRTIAPAGVAAASGTARVRPAAANSPATAPVPRVLVPPTAENGRKAWMPPRPGSWARGPLWLIIGGAAVLLMVGGGGAILLSRSGGKTAIPSTGPATVEPIPIGGVTRSADLYYVVVYQTPAGNLKPTESVAYKHAKFLVDHGIGVSLERVDLPLGGAGSRTESWYWVVSVKGFASLTEAKPYRDNIVNIGDALGPGVWKGAYARKGLSSSGTGEAAGR